MTHIDPETDSTCFVVQFDLNAKGEHLATLAFPEPAVRMNANQLSKLIETLGQVRLNIVPEIDTTPPDLTQKLDPIAFPLWQVSWETMSDGALLHVRHPGYGWLGFVFNGTDLIDLRDILSDVIDEVQKTPRTAN
ncbi:hypothetical protein [Paraburkholderia mimosarum]|uniref:hypothetical protein n=1 Tax=Paraburkholderia mimosarum TaxID=312026 RepID=UPI000486FC3D|nr:hypothetical protein [Paraburkholderia mimosarum]